MLPRLLLTAALSCFIWRAQAQAFEPGYIVRSTGDTLRGEVENGVWEEPPTFIRFRSTSNGLGELFKPRQLRAVALTLGRYFRYQALPIDHAAETRLDRLTQGYTPNVRVDSVLAEVLVEGAASLVRVVRIGATHYVVSRPGQPLLELSERKYLHTGRYGTLEVVNGNNYRAQLERYFGDCPAASRAAVGAEYSAPGLAAVVQAFNETCTPGGAAGRTFFPKKAPHRLAFHIGAAAGARYLLRPTEDGRHWGWPSGGLYGEMLLPNRTVSLYGDLTVGRFSGGGSVQTGTIPSSMVVGGVVYNYTTPVFGDYTYRAWLLTARLGARVYFPLPAGQRIFIGGGFTNDVVTGRRFTLPAGAATPNPGDNDDVGLLLPYAGIGWRANRLSVSLDAMVYSGLRELRAGLAYRLNSNPDATPHRPAAKP
ncbi:hypothetical protein [Hymenobacter properus]|uniref:Outer membrane protein beta-barrel domain-containing protein n=1 Tax=Hymenobacter properus TaxID=2791026 RepID=A0A931BET2_9BACT|nr:hypothetical protein [Hymenobacter properus]MBF9140972.1 hypothetical protein [Hymenobacter properus]MBR7719781.1 hypothetical protein [Microvirga sp. SRT04]